MLVSDLGAMSAGPLMNLDRAHEVLTRHGLSGLILADPLNIYHATGFWPQLSQMGMTGSMIALVSRDSREVGVVLSQFFHYLRFGAWAAEASDIQTFLYHAEPSGDAPVPTRPAFFATREGGDPDAVERRRRRLTMAALGGLAPSASPAKALAQAARALGLGAGRVGVDHPLIAQMLEPADLPVTLEPVDRVLREIRMVKSPAEIALMRRASGANAEAARAVLAFARGGATYADIRGQFHAEAARRGNIGEFLLIDGAGPELDGSVAEGRAFLIDAVSHQGHYHGDYGRTAVLGEPSRRMAEALRGTQAAWEAIREALKPGLRYSDILRIGQAAVARAGVDAAIGVNPHSVGLMHTDEPGRADRPYYAKDDIVLQEGMVLSVDLPVLEADLGGTAHFEDLVLITADGCEPLHESGESLVIL